MSELETVANNIRTAESYLDVFGAKQGTPAELAAHVKETFRRLAKVVHPDRYAKPDDQAVAHEATGKLTRLLNEAIGAIAEGCYGRESVTVTTRKGVHELIRPFGVGTLCATYQARSQLSTTQSTFCKIARNPGDRDLLMAEVSALKRVRGSEADPETMKFMPELLDSFAYTEAGNPRQQANVLGMLEGFYNLEQVKQAYRGTMHPLHMIWMWRRLLMALGHAHDAHVVHGAVLPQHVMILPERHGLVLVDWCYASVQIDKTYPPIKAVVDAYRGWYPAEVVSKKAPSPATDIAMAARCMVDLLGGNPLTGALPASLPKPLRAFFRGCLHESQSMRPGNAWILLKEFDELLESMGSPYYPRRFLPFTMPTGVA